LLLYVRRAGDAAQARLAKFISGEEKLGTSVARGDEAGGRIGAQGPAVDGVGGAAAVGGGAGAAATGRVAQAQPSVEGTMREGQKPVEQETSMGQEERVVRYATASEGAEKKRRLLEESARQQGEVVLGEERMLGTIFEQYPKLRKVRGVGSMIGAWRADPEKARAYAERAQAEGWLDVEDGQGKATAGGGVHASSAIWRALGRGAGPGGSGRKDGGKASKEERHARREQAARAAEQRAEAARQLSMKQLRAGKSTQAGRLAVAVLRAKGVEASKAGEKSVGAGAGSIARLGTSEALAQEFGKDRLERVLQQWRQQAVHERAGGDVVPDFAVLVSVLVADRAADLDVAVASSLADEVGEVDRTRWGRMQASLPAEIVEGLLSAFELQYGARAREILSESWSRDLELWEEFVVDLRGLGVLQVHSDACERDDVMECMRSCLRAHVRFAAICTKTVVAPSDTETQTELRLLGYEIGHGKIWGDSQCLADSLLQLLQREGVLAGDISDPERKEACAENRRRLIAHEDPAVRPRNRCAATGTDRGEDPRAYLQHDVHAEPTIWFFLEWFALKGKVLCDLPRGGICLTVFSRFDSAIGGRAVVQVCGRERPQGRDGVLRLNLYNLTGSGNSGFHYDPLFVSAGVAALDG